VCDKFGGLRCACAESLGQEGEASCIEEMMQVLAEDEYVLFVVDG
jgi:hypothetical protein